MRTWRWSVGACMIALLVAGPTAAQQQPIPEVPEANPSDVESVDAIITALYASISGPAGQARDWERFRSLIAPHGKLIPTTAQSPTGYVYWTPEQYWAQNGQALADIGFTEAEIGRRVETFGMITQVFSTYESYRQDQGDPDTPFARGINSIQLVHHQDRYWIVNIFWDSERPGNPIPEDYIGG